MALLSSNNHTIGSKAPYFNLPAANPMVDLNGKKTRSLDDYTLDDATKANVVVVVFICNHCPYVITIQDRLIALAKLFADRGVQFIAISSNDAVKYPADSFENMAVLAEKLVYPFPYLYDESQDIAKAFDAVCTPDFFVYNQNRNLVYQGRLDDGRPNFKPTTTDLSDALTELLSSGTVSISQIPSMGCGIKWK